MDQLFLLEILVDTIFFNNPDTIYTKKQINIVARFGNFASLEIRNDALGGVEESSKSTDLDFSSGKSYLFPCDANVLLQALKQYPIEMSVGTRMSPAPIGTITIKWSDDFIDMLSFCQDDFGYISPVTHRDIYPMYDGTGKETGHVEVFVRLSCFGKNIQTQFQVVRAKDGKNGSGKTQFLFKSNNAATTFQCQRFGMGTSTDAIPVAPVYNTLELDDRSLKPVYTSRDEGHEPSVFNLDTNAFPTGGRKPSVYDDQVSIMERMDHKFINLDQFRTSEMLGSTVSKNFTEEELTTDFISKYLCGHKDCPAAKKFKELGIGPLACGRGLGTVYNDVEPHVTYGLSHANGSMEHYGPYGFYRRPKRPDQPFERRKSDSPPSTSVHSHSDKSSNCSCHQVLRLTGGGILDEKQYSPIIACKTLMDDFDKLLTAYKRALGPCGQAICPYAQNLILEQCQMYCPMRSVNQSESFGAEAPKKSGSLVGSRPPSQLQQGSPHGSQLQQSGLPVQETLQVTELTNTDANSVSSCGMKNCPYAREMYQPVDEEMKKSQPLPACGDATCPYTKQLLGIVDEETDEAMRLLSCHPDGCAPPPALPPIHWDCPDPLPKGRCTNSNCPINKIQDMAKKMFEPRTVCGGPDCPYAIPPPCTYPTCPFAAAPPCMLPISEICTDPECPLNKMSKESICKDPNCPFATGQPLDVGNGGEITAGGSGSICDDPDCPYKKEGGLTKTNETGAGDNGEEDEEIVDNPIEIIVGDNITPCTPNTCASKGGTLVCLECPCSTRKSDESQPGRKRKMKGPSQSAPVISNKTTVHHTFVNKTSHSMASSSSKKGKKRKKKSKFVYDTGDVYPGVKIGHRECIKPPLNVPHNMGWLWNIKPLGLKPRRGWKPGALTKTMAAIIEKHRAELGLKPLMAGPTPKPSKKKLRKNAYGVYETDSEQEISPKSTLQIKKKDGCYLITMNPLKDPYSLEDNEDPYMDCTPLQFKITKNKPPPPNRGDGGEDFCTCDELIESSSSDSELDIEFTPPAGIIHPDKLKRKKNVVHADTQYSPDDLPKPDKIQVGKGDKKKGKGGKKGKKDKKKKKKKK